MAKIPFNNLKRGYNLYKDEYEEAALRVLRSGWYILGDEVASFEENFARLHGANYCVGVDNGLNAIALGLKALGIKEGDEIIVQANTYIATVLGITMSGATPVLVEPDEFYNIDADKIEKYVNNKTKALLVTHLYGQAARMDKILSLCSEHGLYLVEDCAQAHFAKFNNKNVGTFGIMGFFSFYPTKNLGGFGDGGAIITNSVDLNIKLKTLRNYGSIEKYQNEIIGYNSRLDEIQAALIKVKLSHFSELQIGREKIARKYLAEIKNPSVILPNIREDATHTWHLFVIRTLKREMFRRYLSDNDIMTDIHYPIPPHLSKALAYLEHSTGDFPITENYADTVVSLPIFDGMTEAEADIVIAIINQYVES